jgi:hypothetical protein
MTFDRYGNDEVDATTIQPVDSSKSAFMGLLSVFVLLDCTDYEGCLPTHAFKRKEDAECLKAIAEAYDHTKPHCPECIGDSVECDSEWDKYRKAEQEWSDGHPIKKGFHGSDFYSIYQIPFHT